MAILRIHKKQNNFVILDKTCLSDEKLSWGAKGLHAFLISLPDDWQVRVSDLQKRSTNGRDAVRGFLNELERAGYIQKSPRRNDDTGRFGGLEYLVLENPESDFEQNSPTPENPFSVKNEQIAQTLPSTEKPRPGNPAPENTTLLNINRINNNKINNKTAAESTTENLENTVIEEQAAAVIFSQNDGVKQYHKPNTTPSNKISILSQEDALISEALTINQIKRVNGLIAKLPIKNKEDLFNEVSYCLLNKAQFTGCRNDFSKKLNAIRSVILRGDWLTPAGLAEKETCRQQPSRFTELERSLREAKAEEIHFSRLLHVAKEDAKPQLNEFVQKAQKKVAAIENSLNQLAGTGSLHSMPSEIITS